MPTVRREVRYHSAVPRIDAPTVAEHHATRVTELTRLAVEIVEADGADALTLAELARRAGLSRPTLYCYFSSREDLLATICEQAVTAWVGEVTAAMETETDPVLRLRAFITAQLEAATTNRHQTAFALLESAVEGRERVLAAHAPLREALLDAVQEIGLDADLDVVPIVEAVVASAYAQIRAGADPAVMTDDVRRFVEAGLGGLARR